MTKDEQQPSVRHKQTVPHMLHTAEENGSYVDIYNLIKTEQGNDCRRQVVIHKNVHEDTSVCIGGGDAIPHTATPDALLAEQR